jgi:hypothetical protein
LAHTVPHHHHHADDVEYKLKFENVTQIDDKDNATSKNARDEQARDTSGHEQNIFPLITLLPPTVRQYVSIFNFNGGRTLQNS